MFVLYIFVNNYTMKKLNLYNIIDIIFKSLLIFLLTFVWVRYFVKSLTLAIILSLFITFMIEIFSKIIKRKINSKKQISIDEENKIEEITNSLIYLPNEKVVTYFYNLAKSKHNATKKTKYIEINHTNSNIVLYPIFRLDELNSQNVLDIYNTIKTKNVKRIIICTNIYNAKAKTTASKLDKEIILLNSKQTYFELIKKYAIYPEKVELKKGKKQTFSDFISYALNKKRTKGYFYSSLLILFCSFFVPYSLYYVIMSSILLVLAFASFSNPTFNKPNNIKLLDI